MGYGQLRKPIGKYAFLRVFSVFVLPMVISNERFREIIHSDNRLNLKYPTAGTKHSPELTPAFALLYILVCFHVEI